MTTTISSTRIPEWAGAGGWPSGFLDNLSAGSGRGRNSRPFQTFTPGFHPGLQIRYRFGSRWLKRHHQPGLWFSQDQDYCLSRIPSRESKVMSRSGCRRAAVRPPNHTAIHHSLRLVFWAGVVLLKASWLSPYRNWCKGMPWDLKVPPPHTITPQTLVSSHTLPGTLKDTQASASVLALDVRSLTVRGLCS